MWLREMTRRRNESGEIWSVNNEELVYQSQVYKRHQLHS